MSAKQNRTAPTICDLPTPDERAEARARCPKQLLPQLLRAQRRTVLAVQDEIEVWDKTVKSYGPLAPGSDEVTRARLLKMFREDRKGIAALRDWLKAIGESEHFELGLKRIPARRGKRKTNAPQAS